VVTSSQPAADTQGWRRNPKIEEAPLQGELMLFDPTSAKFFVLNRTMAFLWRHCDGALSLGAILDRMVQDFADVEPAAAETDLRAALQELVDLGLLIRA
jgi:PqqD family protein of HPr-rel-A system